MVTLGIETTGKQIVAEYGANAKGKTVVVTGPSQGGLGAELLITLAAAEPAHLILAGRSESKIIPVIQKINEVNSNVKTTFVQLDLLELSSVRQAAKEINAAVDSIDVLVNNAGLGARKQYELSKEGLEAGFAANHLGHFLLTNLLIEKIAKVKGMVINISSMAYVLAGVNTKDINFDDGKDYNAWIAYARSKTANILFTFGLAEKYGDKLAAFAVDPGMIMETKLAENAGVDEALFAEGFALFAALTEDGKPPEIPVVSSQQGVAPSLVAALDPSFRAKAPALVKECQVIDVLPQAKDSEEVKTLWDASEKLVGEKFGA